MSSHGNGQQGVQFWCEIREYGVWLAPGLQPQAVLVHRVPPEGIIAPDGFVEFEGRVGQIQYQPTPGINAKIDNLCFPIEAVTVEAALERFHECMEKAVEHAKAETMKQMMLQAPQQPIPKVKAR